MIQPKLNLKNNKHAPSLAENKELTKQFLMASCSGDLFGFPKVWDVKSRQNCYINNSGEINYLNAFWDALQSAVKQVLILDSYFLNPETPSGINKENLISKRILTIKAKLEDLALNHPDGLEVKILTDSPYSADKKKEEEMLANFDEVKELAQELCQQGSAGVELSVCLDLTKKFDYIHDRFAIIDDELWHFGGTVGGFNSKLSVASRGWDATKLNAIEFFNEVWQECVC